MTVNVLASLKSRLMPFLDTPSTAQANGLAPDRPDFALLMGNQVGGAPLPLSGAAVGQQAAAATAVALPGPDGVQIPAGLSVIPATPIIGTPSPSVGGAGSPVPLDRPAADVMAAQTAQAPRAGVGAPAVPDTASPDQTVPKDGLAEDAQNTIKVAAPVDLPEVAIVLTEDVPAADLATLPVAVAVGRKAPSGQIATAADVPLETGSDDGAVDHMVDKDKTVKADKGQDERIVGGQITPIPIPTPAPVPVGTPARSAPVIASTPTVSSASVAALDSSMTGIPLPTPAMPKRAAPAAAAVIGAPQSRKAATSGASSDRSSAPLGEATALLRLLSGHAQTGEKGKGANIRGDSLSDTTSLTLTPAAGPVAPMGHSPAAASPVELSASLGQQVINMSSGGQWIDGLAKEIATLAAGSGQGTFRLSPENLGPMRVDVRNGSTGAEVRLTVETEAAKIALDKDSDRLKDDSRLSAIRIADVTVERIQRIAEPARSEATTGQNSSSNPQPNQQNATQMAFSQGQANGHQSGGQHSGDKTSPNTAVLSHAEPQDPDVDDSQSALRHARYA